MLELTYLISVKVHDIVSIKNLDLISYYFKNNDNGEIELQVPVESDTVNILADYLDKHDIAVIQNNSVTLIRFYT